MLDQQTVIAEIERRTQNINLTVAEICARAGIHPTTFSRWKKTDRTPNPGGANYDSFVKIFAAIETEETRLAGIGKAASADHSVSDTAEVADDAGGNGREISAHAVPA